MPGISVSEHSTMYQSSLEQNRLSVEVGKCDSLVELSVFLKAATKEPENWQSSRFLSHPIACCHLELFGLAHRRFIPSWWGSSSYHWSQEAEERGTQPSKDMSLAVSFLM